VMSRLSRARKALKERLLDTEAESSGNVRKLRSNT
jgi:DNA-directed RNA polymerase specialized sigma24 family protein